MPLPPLNWCASTTYSLYLQQLSLTPQAAHMPLTTALPIPSVSSNKLMQLWQYIPTRIQYVSRVPARLQTSHQLNRLGAITPSIQPLLPLLRHIQHHRIAFERQGRTTQPL